VSLFRKNNLPVLNAWSTARIQDIWGLSIKVNVKSWYPDLDGAVVESYAQSAASPAESQGAGWHG